MRLASTRHVLSRRAFLARSPTLHKRQFVSLPTLASLGNGFLDLAIALPYPPSFPPYSTTIILSTVLLRLVLLPGSIWARQRKRRLEESVVPDLKSFAPLVSKSVQVQMIKEQLVGDKEFFIREHRKRCNELIRERKKALYKEHRCSPLLTNVLPTVIQLPPFVLYSLILAQVCTDPLSPLDSESFLTLTSLTHSDTTFAIPVGVGLLSLANVDASTWFNNPPATAAPKQNERRINIPDVVRGSLRVLSIGRIIITALTPGGVALYWLSSAALGLVQTWVLEWQDKRWRLARGLLNSEVGPGAVGPKAANAKVVVEQKPDISLRPSSGSQQRLSSDPSSRNVNDLNAVPKQSRKPKQGSRK